MTVLEILDLFFILVGLTLFVVCLGSFERKAMEEKRNNAEGLVLNAREGYRSCAVRLCKERELVLATETKFLQAVGIKRICCTHCVYLRVLTRWWSGAWASSRRKPWRAVCLMRFVVRLDFGFGRAVPL